jgi:hypothetical protein
VITVAFGIVRCSLHTTKQLVASNPKQSIVLAITVNAPDSLILVPSSLIKINCFPNQLIKLIDLSKNNYYVKMLSPGVNFATTTIVNPSLYQPGYYTTADTFGNGSPYYSIYDKNGFPIWYLRSTSDVNNLNSPQVCSLFLGNDKNLVIGCVFNGDACRTITNIDTLQTQNFYAKNDTRYNRVVLWDVHEALQIKAPANRKGNMIFVSYYTATSSGISAFYIQEQNPSGNIVFEIYSEDYFTDSNSETFHINAVDVHPVKGNILCSFRNNSTIACFNYQTKNLDWVIDSFNSLIGITIAPLLTKFLTIIDTYNNSCSNNNIDN